MGGHVLTLAAVEDVAGAEYDEALRGHQAAFSLRFTGPADALPSALHEVRHDVLGPFPLFVGPVGTAVGRTQQYHAVVDRTMRVRIAAAPESPSLNPPPPADRPPPKKEDAPEDDERVPGEVRGDAAPSAPTARDLEIVEERAVAHRDARVRRRRRTRRARHRLRRAHAERTSFLRKQRRTARKRAAKIRRGWLRRHGV